MISSVTVKVSAAHPNAPLGPFYVIMGSAMSLTVVDVPRALGSREITGVVIKAKNADGEERGIPATRVGSAWGATVPDDFFDRVGTISNGLTVNAVGKDETGAEETWVLGSGQLIVLDDTGVITPEEKRNIVKWYTSQPANPVNGDACSIDGVPCIYTRGQWRPFGGGGGDMKHSEFSDLEASDNMTQKQSNALLQTIVTRLKGTTPMLLAPLLVLASLLASAAPLSPSTDHGDINPTTKVSTVVRSIVDGAARSLPKYLHAIDFDDSYPAEAAEYYRSRGDGKTDGGCSSVRSGGYLSRNFDFPFDERAEFVVRMSAGVQTLTANGQQLTAKRFASVGIAQVGTNLTEEIVTSGKPSRCYKWLPGATVDGINENGVVAEINVVDGEPPASTGGDIHPLAAVRWALDNGTSAEMVATSLAARIQFPAGWSQNYHWMIADETSTYIVENGDAHAVTNGVPVMTNFRLYPTRDTTGAGQERYDLLADGEPITNAWYTRAYRPDTTPPWVSEFNGDLAALALATNYWARAPREAHRGETFSQPQPSTSTLTWWQSVHTSVYDISNRTLRVAVQETDDWYIFAVPSAGGTDEAKVREIASEVVAPVASTVSGLQSSKADRTELDGYMPLRGAALRGGNGFHIDIDQKEVFSVGYRSYGLLFGEYGKGLLLDIFGFEIDYPKSALMSGDWFYGSRDEAHRVAVKGDIPVISATDPTFSNAVKAVMEVRDVPKNLKYTITADNDRFYFTPTGAINPED